MEVINKLLDKYFEGNTSLDEEKQLKSYFKTGNIHSEHEKYKVLFDIFEEENKVKFPTILQKKQKTKISNRQLFWIQGLTIAGIAASILLVFWLNANPTTSDFAIIKGKRIDNSLYAQQLALEKIEKMNNLIEKSMQPIQQINKVKNSLKPIRKIKETRNSIRKIQNKNYIK